MHRPDGYVVGLEVLKNSDRMGESICRSVPNRLGAIRPPQDQVLFAVSNSLPTIAPSLFLGNVYYRMVMSGSPMMVLRGCKWDNA